ncbi:MAG: molecular chaperone TorD family protein [Halopseudomonas sp.]
MSSPVERSQARSELMQLLALGWSHPTPERYQLIADGSYQAVLAQVTQLYFGAPCELNLPLLPFSDFESLYIELFSVGNNGKPAVGLNAGDYGQLLDGQPRPEFMQQYAGWYKHFGIKVRQSEQSNEQPDHLVCQLEFLAWLAKLEADHDGKPVLQNGYQRAQRDFLQRHLQPFLAIAIPKLEQQVSKRNGSAYFAELGNLLSDVSDKIFHELNSVLGPSLQVIDATQASTTSTAENVDLWS